MNSVRIQLLLAVCIALHGAPAAAQQRNVQVDAALCPPPLAWHAFERGRLDVRTRAAYFTMERDGQQEMDLRGGGLDMIFRSVFSDVLAGSLQIGLFGMNGTGTSVNADLPAGTVSTIRSELSLGQFLVAGIAEVQLVRSGRAGAILFAGPAFTSLVGSMDQVVSMTGSVTGNYADSPRVYGHLYGLQGGLQAGMSFGRLRADLFGMLSSRRGSTTVSAFPQEVKTDVPATPAVTYGVDLSALPWNLSLGLMMQAARDTGVSGGFRARMFQVSWKF